MRAFMKKLLRAQCRDHSSAAERRLMEKLEALLSQMEITMSKLSDFLAAQAAHNLEVSDDLDTVKTLTAALVQQVADLKTQLSAGGNLSDADSAAIDALTDSGNHLVAKADALAGKAPPAPPAPEEPAQVEAPAASEQPADQAAAAGGA